MDLQWINGTDSVAEMATKTNVNFNEVSGSVSNAVPSTRTINSKPLSADITLLASDVGSVPTARTINSKALSSDIALTASDVGAINPNLIINGEPQAWQRGTSFFGITNNTYTADRFKLFAQGSCDVAKDGKWIKTTVNNTGINTQTTTLEIPDSLLGKTVTLSFLAKTNVSASSTIYIWNGKLITNVIKSQAISLTTTEQRFTTTFTIPASLTNNLLYIWFTRLEAFVGGTCWMSECKLELGSVATPFVPRPYGEELALCQRYYQVRSVNTIADVDLRPSMRITPTKTAITSGYAYDAEI